MLKALGLRSGSSSRASLVSNSPSSASLSVLEDAFALERAMYAMDLVFDDRPAESNAILEKGNSTYFKLARGVIAFIDATLGFEAESIKKAVDSLYEAEVASTKSRHLHEKQRIQTSSYPPGTEYMVTYAESQLMGAISLFLSESMLDTAKALLKLRKAFQTLDEVSRIVAATKKTSATSGAADPDGNSNTLPSEKTLSDKASMLSVSSAGTSTTPSKDIVSTFTKLQEARQTRKALGSRVNSATPSATASASVSEPVSASASTISLADSLHYARAGFDSVDEFIESGMNAMFGILQLVISIIPPNIGKLLSIVGFHGTQQQGLQMLWKASEVSNIHGAIALLALLQFYDGPTRISETKADDAQSIERSVTTASARSSKSRKSATAVNSRKSDKMSAEEAEEIKKRLKHALYRTRDYYCNGPLWILQEGRMAAAEGHMEEAVEIMDRAKNIQVKQVDGLMLFDKNNLIVMLRRFETAAVNYNRMLTLNTWSHALYKYMEGACYTELYRQNRRSNPEKAAEYKKLGNECLKVAPTMLGKKKFMAKSMPFDLFVVRKVKALEEVAAKYNVDLVDATTTSSVYETIFFWNGLNRMNDENAEATLKDLSYSASEGTPFHSDYSQCPIPEDDNSLVTRLMLSAICLSKLKRYEECITLLDEHVLPKIWTPTPHKGYLKSGLPRVQYHKVFADEWAPPSAIFERAMAEWHLNGIKSAERVKDYLDLAAGWADDYELSTRVGMRIKAAQENVRAAMEEQ